MVHTGRVSLRAPCPAFQPALSVPKNKRLAQQLAYFSGSPSSHLSSVESPRSFPRIQVYPRPELPPHITSNASTLSQAGIPANIHTRKCLKAFLGTEYESVPVLLKDPNGLPPKGPRRVTKPKAAARLTRTRSVSKRKRVATDMTMP
ncbi:hypothetical protein D9756_011045 [Leucocoprinus leucothites]|uniref:Uncharacterized protein n=1 Tax=Leucocoprinus leucothites TaxID=201217 RepID=A0A8H5CPJ2_9AGAR|nr:hypothetical protein D9756_011045 [Leucoagaricus leucothites]